MSCKRSALGLLVVLAAGACASTPDGDVDAQDIVGCYYFDQEESDPQLSLPWGVHLTAEPLTGWGALDQEPETYEAVTLVGPEQTRDFPFGYWQSRSADSVRIGYPSLGAYSLDLVVEEEGHLEGRALDVGDAGLQERQSYPVRLQRARCPE